MPDSPASTCATEAALPSATAIPAPVAIVAASILVAIPPVPIELYDDLIATLSQLRASGHEQKSLRRELRDNLLAKLAAGEDPCRSR